MGFHQGLSPHLPWSNPHFRSPGLACSQPGMCSPSGTHGQCRQTSYRAAGERRLDIRRASAHSCETAAKLLNSLNHCSLCCESSLKSQKGLRHNPQKGPKTENYTFSSCVIWDAPRWSLPQRFHSILRYIHYINKGKHLKSLNLCKGNSL